LALASMMNSARAAEGTAIVIINAALNVAIQPIDR
jgi:hypothetical protein